MSFVKDECNFMLKETLKNKLSLKEIHIDCYPRNPLTSLEQFMLLSRTIVRNVAVLNDGNRLILKKNDKYNTIYMNILFSEVRESYYLISENYAEFILKIHNTYISLFVFV